MAADHAEEDPATAEEVPLGDGRTEVVDCVGIAEGVVADHTAEAAGCNSEERSWDDSSEVPEAGVEEVAGDRVEDHPEADPVVEDLAVEDDGCSATEDLHIHLGDHLEGQELEGLCMARGCEDHRELVGLGLEEDPVGVGLGGHYNHCMVQMSENHRVRPDCRLCRLEEHRRRVVVAAHIRTEEAAADRSSGEEVLPEEEVVEGSCIDPTCLGASSQYVCDSDSRHLR